MVNSSAPPKSPKKKSTPKLDFSKMAPYGLQKIIMEHKARFKVVAFGRQSGKSWLAKRVLLEEAANNHKRCWWVAPSIPTAADHWEDLLRLIEDSGLPTASINKSTKTIKFLGGGSIRIRSAEVPDNLRGGTLDFLVLDEAAFMAENVWFKILQPTITASRGSVMFLSTPNGQNWFYRLFKLGQNDKFPDFMSWHMPSTEAPYQDHQMLDIIRQTVPAMVWREEYMAEFLADSGGVFAGLDKVVPREMIYDPIPGHVYEAGIDWGMDGDYTIFTVADKYEQKQVYGERFNSIGTIEQANRIIDLLNHWKPEVAYIEMNGVGAPMYRLIRDKFQDSRSETTTDNYKEYLGLGGHTKIRGIFLNNAKKRQMIESLAAAIEWGRFSPLVRMDDNDTETYGAIQMSEMSTFQRKRTASGLEVTYSAAEGYHDDTVMGLALCYIGLNDYILRTERGNNELSDEAVKEFLNDRRAAIRRTPKANPFRASRPRQSGRANTRRSRRDRRSA